MSANDPTAGERFDCRDCTPESKCDAHWCCAGCDRTPAEPDAGDVEALAKVLNDADNEALVRTNFGQIAATYEETAHAILAADWLDAVRRKAGDERAEQIAQAIEASAPTPGDAYAREPLAHARNALYAAARIARGDV